MSNYHRFKRFFSALIAVVLLLSILESVAGTVSAATGGTSILSSTAANACIPKWTSLNGPTYAETVNGDLEVGDMTLTAPPGFEFNAASTVTIVLTQGDPRPEANMNRTVVGDIVATARVTSTTITFTITAKSRGNVRNTIEWRGIQVRPTNRLPPFADGIITASGTSVTNGQTGLTSTTSFGRLTEVGAATQLVVTLPGETFRACEGNSGTVSDQTSGVSFNMTRITANDAEFNINTTYAGTRTLSYTGPSAPASYTTSVNFSDGQSTTTLTTTLNVAETTRITVSDGTITGPPSSLLHVVPAVTGFNAFETSTASGATSGVIKTKIAGSGFDLAIVALRAGPALATNFTGTVKVELVNSSDTAANCSTWPLIRALADQTFVAADQGRRTISGIVEPNVWRNVRVRMTFTGSSSTIVSCSNDNFAIRPSALVVAVTNQNSDTAGTTNTLNNATFSAGATIHKAGRPFTVRVTAQNSSAVTTTNYAGSPTATTSQCDPSNVACSVATLGTLSLGTVMASSGVLTTNTASYTEVGAFNLTLVDETFAAVDAADGSTELERYTRSTTTLVGRFVPDYFIISTGVLTPRIDINTTACRNSSFTYMNEPFRISYMLTARNALNATVQNYTGNLARLDPINPSHLNLAAVDSVGNLTASISGITSANPGRVTTSTAHGLITGSRVYISGVNGMDSINNALYTVTVIDANNFTIGVDTSSFGSYLSRGTASRLSVLAAGGTPISSSGSWAAGVANITSSLMLQRAVQPDGPFNTLGIGIAPRDPDAIQLLPTALNIDADKNGTNERFNLGATQSRFGRLHLANAYGSELLNLSIPIQVQFWNGTAFQTNMNDSCTSIAAANVALNNYRGGIMSGNMSAANVSIGGVFNNGIGNLVLTKPSPKPSEKGSVDVTINLTAENKTYMQGRWFGTSFNENPSARATFGIYKGGPIIYGREMY